jgi:PAS domain-containing protein
MSSATVDLTTNRLLLAIAEGTAHDTGSEFLRSLVRCLSSALEVRYAFVSEFAEVKTRVRTLAFWDGAGFLDNFEYELAGTPCEAILAGEMKLYPHGVQDLFPEHRDELAEIDAESYLAIPLLNSAAEVMGHLALIDVKPMTGSDADLAVFRIFAARAAAELDRLQVETARRQTEERLAAILASAMDAIVTVDADRRIGLFNDAAERMFRCSREAVLGQTPGRICPTDILM